MYVLTTPRAENYKLYPEREVSLSWHSALATSHHNGKVISGFSCIGFVLITDNLHFGI